MEIYKTFSKNRKPAIWIVYILLIILCGSFLIISGTNAAYGQEAKYIILMVADGQGPNHIEATNAYTGITPTYQSQWARYWISTFPYGGSYDTTQAWTNFNYVLGGATDSAVSASALYSGNRTNNGRVSVSYDGSERFFTIGEIAKSLSKGVGVVTTVPISDATPGVFCAHNDNRGNTYAIADECLFGYPNTTGTVANDPKYGGGHGPTSPSVDVIIGDGRYGYVNDAIRIKLTSESGHPGKHFFVKRQTGIDGGDALWGAANDPTVVKLAGLFDHIYRHDPSYSMENPTLAESATAALTVLHKNPNGFVLMIEGGAVDWASHSNNMDLMIGEMIDFNEAVQTVIDWVDDPNNDSDWSNTLVIITADHETGYLTASPGIFQDQPLGEVSDATLDLEKILTNSGGRRASWEESDGDNVIDPGEFVYWAWNSGGHTNTLIPLYARGAGAELFANYSIYYDSVRGPYLDNTDVFKVMDSVIGNSSNAVTILEPNDGEIIPSGSNYTVRWEAPVEAATFKLRLSLDNGLTWKLLAGDITDRSYNWNVPVPLGNKRKCLLKVIGYDDSGRSIGSYATTIQIEVVRTDSPKEGDILISGNGYPITWTTNATQKEIAKVRLYYTKNGGVNWNPICDPFTGKCALEGNPGSFDWTVPTERRTSTKCKIKVELRDEKGNILPTDASDGYFTIQP